MGFIIRGFIWDIPIRIFAYVLFWGPIQGSSKASLYPLLCCIADAKGLSCSVASLEQHCVGASRCYDTRHGISELSEEPFVVARRLDAQSLKKESWRFWAASCF